MTVITMMTITMTNKQSASQRARVIRLLSVALSLSVLDYTALSILSFQPGNVFFDKPKFLKKALKNHKFLV